MHSAEITIEDLHEHLLRLARRVLRTWELPLEGGKIEPSDLATDALIRSYELPGKPTLAVVIVASKRWMHVAVRKALFPGSVSEDSIRNRRRVERRGHHTSGGGRKYQASSWYLSQSRGFAQPAGSVVEIDHPDFSPEVSFPHTAPAQLDRAALGELIEHLEKNFAGRKPTTLKEAKEAYAAL